MTEFETHVQSQLLHLRQQLDAAVAADEPDQVASLSFQIDDLQRLSRANGRDVVPARPHVRDLRADRDMSERCAVIRSTAGADGSAEASWAR